MSNKLPLSIPGDMLRKAIAEYTELLNNQPEMTHQQRLHKVCLKFDLSPLQSDFLNKQLKNSSTK